MKQREVCQKEFRETCNVYCPYCGSSEHLDTNGTEISKGSIFQCYICSKCDLEFAIRYENPVFVSSKEMCEEIKKAWEKNND